jgi:hypothetical protein
VRPTATLSILAACALVAPLAAQPVACPAGGFDITGADPALAVSLCHAAEEAAAALEACNLPQRSPLTIEVVDEIAHPFGTCLAAYDCAYSRIRLVLREDYTDLVDPDDPYAAMPRDVLHGTLLTHEITHALVEQNTPGREVPLIDHEYIAAAMELDHLPPEWRGAILDYAGLDAPATGRINIWIYRIAPRRFAANAWLHFAAPGHGCDLIGELLAGTVTFEDEPR